MKKLMVITVFLSGCLGPGAGGGGGGATGGGGGVATTNGCANASAYSNVQSQSKQFLSTAAASSTVFYPPLVTPTTVNFTFQRSAGAGGAVSDSFIVNGAVGSLFNGFPGVYDGFFVTGSYTWSVDATGALTRTPAAIQKWTAIETMLPAQICPGTTWTVKTGGTQGVVSTGLHTLANITGTITAINKTMTYGTQTFNDVLQVQYQWSESYSVNNLLWTYNWTGDHTVVEYYSPSAGGLVQRDVTVNVAPGGSVNGVTFGGSQTYNFSM